jgi:hypothetical protein
VEGWLCGEGEAIEDEREDKFDDYSVGIKVMGQKQGGNENGGRDKCVSM